MSEDINISINESGHMIVYLYKKKFASTEPIKVTAGKVKASDIEKLIYSDTWAEN